jgi:predicted CoA-binding protein/anti-sigma regulatory factor (Ser/Thr protein kinase)
LEELSSSFSTSQLAAVLAWLGRIYTIHSLLAEIDQGAERISEIVKALKMYIYLDQAPVQLVDIHEGLNNTLILLRSKLKSGVNVLREFASQLPRIQAYGSELNQVWTNIIDNAIAAMDGKGEIIIRTRQEGDWIVVEIEDNGPGIPEEVKNKIFEPFFTTKPPGEGTGLGLNIIANVIQRHSGEVQVHSRPGQTIFEIRLPVNFEAVQSGELVLQPIQTPDDETLRHIFDTTTTIAVVGITDQSSRPAYSVPAYLQSQGYRVIPVNPNLERVLGETCYPELTSIPEQIDTVLIFRRSEAVPPIVEAAIQAGVKTIWMQEGIVNQEAADRASRAGLQVVMDTCMRAQHKRLYHR